jgi:hypothetical protein
LSSRLSSLFSLTHSQKTRSSHIRTLPFHSSLCPCCPCCCAEVILGIKRRAMGTCEFINFVGKIFSHHILVVYRELDSNLPPSFPSPSIVSLLSQRSPLF